MSAPRHLFSAGAVPESGIPLQQMETQTQRGLRRFSIGIGLFLISSAIGIVVAYYSLLTAPDIPNLINQTTGEANQAALSRFLPTVPALCGFAIFTVFAFIELLLGFLSFYRGKDEYGEEHRRDMERAVLFLVLAIVMVIMSIVASLAGSVGGVIGVFNAMNVVSAIADILRAVVIAFILFYLIRTFLSSDRIDRAYLAIGLYVAGPIASYLASITYAPPAEYFEPESNIPFDPSWMIPTIVGVVFSLISLAIFLLLYRHALRRFRNGEIRPIWQKPGTATIVQQFQEQRWQPPPGA